MSSGRRRATAKSRSPDVGQVVQDSLPALTGGREQRESRAAARVLRMTFPSLAKPRLCPCLFQETSLTSPAGRIWGWQPCSSGGRRAPAAGRAAAGHFHPAAAPRVPSRWPGTSGVGGERRSRAPLRLNAPQRGPPAFSCCPFRHLEGKFPHCKRIARNGTEQQPREVSRTVHRSAPRAAAAGAWPQRCPSIRWGQGDAPREGKF